MSEQNAAEKENVLIRAGKCAVTLLPGLGGKIASIQFDGRELLQPPLAPYAPRTRTMSFDAGDASGWDECLPSVAACTVPTELGPVSVPDHGDLWRVPWDVQIAEPTSASFRGQCFSLPLVVDRSVSLTAIEQGAKLTLDYTVSNTGNAAAPWSWAAHPLFTAAAGDRITLPPSVKTLRLEGSGGNRLGVQGDSIDWPLATLADGSTTDLSIAAGADSGIGDKLFAGPLFKEQGWCVLDRFSAGIRIKVSFEPTATPYLGLWICYGGWPDRPGPKQMCVALEPATAPVDSLAQNGPWSRTLAPGESFAWSMSVEITSIENTPVAIETI
jgi:galactose mutarotase-like enzyme